LTPPGFPRARCRLLPPAGADRCVHPPRRPSRRARKPKEAIWKVSYAIPRRYLPARTHALGLRKNSAFLRIQRREELAQANTVRVFREGALAVAYCEIDHRQMAQQFMTLRALAAAFDKLDITCRQQIPGLGDIRQPGTLGLCDHHRVFCRPL